MPIHLQVKLLRVIQDRLVIPVGGNKPVRIDARVVTATNKNLEDLIRDRLFREDLYYRINVIPINIPPLRERKEDIEPLLEFLFNKYCGIYDIDVPKFREDIMEFFRSYPWIGNIRELENAVEYIINMLGGDREVSKRHLPPKLIEACSSLNIEEELKLQNLERMAIIKALMRYGNNTENKKKAADALGISLASLYRKINSYDIDVVNL